MRELNVFRIPFIAALILSFFFAGSALRAQQNQAATPPDYRIAPGDVLQIDVWKQPEITRTIPVRSDGKILLPLINDVAAAGLTTAELASSVREKLHGLVPQPQVFVSVAQHGATYLYSPSPSSPIRIVVPASPVEAPAPRYFDPPSPAPLPARSAARQCF
jgi:Polysaccharide biosynthesis/export protein